MNSNTLLLTALGVMFCSGCTTEQQMPAELKKLGAKIKVNKQGENVTVDLRNTPITDAGLVHLKGLAGLQTLAFNDTQITDVGIVHLKGLTSLQSLSLRGTQITDTGLVHLQGDEPLNNRA